MIVKEVEPGRRLMLFESWPSFAGKKRPPLVLVAAWAGSSWRGKMCPAAAGWAAATSLPLRSRCRRGCVKHTDFQVKYLLL